MQLRIRQFLFGTSLSSNVSLNIAWLLFRLHTGISIALHAGWPKVENPEQWFTDQVAGLGFTFPSPVLWAYIASWGELIGGILIAIGLFTRPAAFQLAFQFFVIAFLWYDNPEPLSGMYFQQLYFWCYLLITVAGAGRYSLDNLISRRVNIVVKKSVLPVSVAVLLFFSMSECQAQGRPLKGEGHVITRNVDLKDFNQLKLKDLDGKIEVRAGEAYSISIEIDQNLEPLLNVKQSEQTLLIELKDNQNNKLYIEHSNILVRITLPVLREILHDGNSDLKVSGIKNEQLLIKAYGNGNCIFIGTSRMLNLEKSGNGDLDAGKLSAENIRILTSGNGDVIIRTDAVFDANGSGNGDVINCGTGQPSRGSGISGNGEIRTESNTSSVQVEPTIKREELNFLSGQWKGRLTYLDYQSNRSYTLPCSILVKEGLTEQSLSLSYEYSNEPTANVTEEWIISVDGRTLDGGKLISRTEKNGILLLVTEKREMDDDRPATSRYTFELSKKRMVVRKEVKYSENEAFIQRSEYLQTRN